MQYAYLKQAGKPNRVIDEMNIGDKSRHRSQLTDKEGRPIIIVCALF